MQQFAVALFAFLVRRANGFDCTIFIRCAYSRFNFDEGNNRRVVYD